MPLYATILNTNASLKAIILSDAFLMQNAIKTDRPWPVRTLHIQIGQLSIPMEVIDSFDQILDDFADSDPDDTDKIPYFAEMWPSAIALAKYIEKKPQLVQNKKIIELGCGLGLPSIVAAKLGATTCLATDFHPACIPYCHANITRNNVNQVRCLTLDWRYPRINQTFDVIIGSDLLYEEPQTDALMHCMAKIQKGSTRLILADPLRKHIQTAVEKLEQAHWQIELDDMDDILILTATQNSAPTRKQSARTTKAAS